VVVERSEYFRDISRLKRGRGRHEVRVETRDVNLTPTPNLDATSTSSDYLKLAQVGNYSLNFHIGRKEICTGVSVKATAEASP
jgi:hypothetical protein